MSMEAMREKRRLESRDTLSQKESSRASGHILYCTLSLAESVYAATLAFDVLTKRAEGAELRPTRRIRAGIRLLLVLGTRKVLV